MTTPYCDDSVLESDTGPVNIEINWEPNEINLHWYDGDTELNVASESQSCLYDAALTAPTIIPTKTGYTFRGWRVRCRLDDLSGLDTTIRTTNDATHRRWKPISDTGYTMEDASVTENSSDLNNGEWAVTFSYGTVKGMAKCSNTNGTYATVGSPSDTNGRYCWCGATGYTPDGGTQCSIASPSWVFLDDSEFAWNCAYDCVVGCAIRVVEEAVFRRAVFGVSQ